MDSSHEIEASQLFEQSIDNARVYTNEDQQAYDFNYYLENIPLPLDSSSVKHSTSLSNEDFAEQFDFTLRKTEESKENNSILANDTLREFSDLEDSDNLQSTVKEFEVSDRLIEFTKPNPKFIHFEITPRSKQSEFLSPYESSTNYSEKQKFLSSGISVNSFQSEIISDIDVLCINCYECISVDDVDRHSELCLKPTIEDFSPSSVEIRLIKLYNTIRSKKIDAYGDVLLVLIELEEYSQAILDCSMNSYDLLDRLDNISKSCMLMREGISCSIIARRLMNLIEVKGPFHSIKREEIEDKLKLYEEEMARQQKELERWRIRSEILMELIGNLNPKNLLEITSDMGSEAFASNSISSKATEITEQREDDITPNILTSDELEKYFYSICIRKKMIYPKDHPAKGVIIYLLFQKCKDQNVPVTVWDDFIEENLKNATNV